ncbi:MAG: transglycosylase domain-containing protein [Acidimicrobiia bacterium]
MHLLAKLAAVVAASGLVTSLTVTALAVPGSWLGDLGSGEPAEIELGPLAQRSYVYASDGSVLASLRDEENRQPVPLDEVPPHVVAAILAVEDAGFWVHEGYDVRGMLRALRANVDAGNISQGGSTVTQQLVKLDLLGSQQTLDRKVQEIVLAARLERQMSKEEILTRYLNSVYFGNHAYGVQAAAETYFGVGVGELDPGQAALLAGMIRNPVANDPVEHPERAGRRRAAALERMVDEGIITEAEQIWWTNAPLPTELHEVVPEPDDHFVEEVKQQLLRDERLGKTYEERFEAVFRGGLKVHTTLDPRAQVLAIAARARNLPLVGGTFPQGTDPETGEERYGSAAVVSLQPSTGAVRAMVGGPTFEDEQFNVVTAKPGRNPGSAFKVFVLTELMEQGKSPNDRISGVGPCRFANPDGEPNPYEVQNFENSSGSVDTIVGQTLRSSNCAYVRLGVIAGHDQVIDMAHRLGIGSDLPSELSLPLGTGAVTPLEMASAYATLANDGVRNAPYYIERVEDRHGRTIFEHEPASKRVVEPRVARLVTDILIKNIQSGTGRAAAIRTGHVAAGKTGTHQASRDGWFVGYSRHLATAVWVGGLEKQFPIVLDGRRLTGGSFPAQIWGDYMTGWHEGKPAEGFPAPGPAPPGTELKVSRDIDLSRPPDRPPVFPPFFPQQPQQPQPQQPSQQQPQPQQPQPGQGGGGGDG